MKTIIYIDGFNLYFRLLEKRPALKWLNIKALSERLLDRANRVVAVKYYTARVSGRIEKTRQLANSFTSLRFVPCRKFRYTWAPFSCPKNSRAS